MERERKREREPSHNPVPTITSFFFQLVKPVSRLVSQRWERVELRMVKGELFLKNWQNDGLQTTEGTKTGRTTQYTPTACNGTCIQMYSTCKVI